MEDLREEIKNDMLEKIKNAKGDSDSRHTAVYIFRDFVSALFEEARAKSISED